MPGFSVPDIEGKRESIDYTAKVMERGMAGNGPFTRYQYIRKGFYNIL